MLSTLRAAALMTLIALPAVAEDFTIFAAASLTDALTEAATQHEATSGDHATLVFAGSSALARQITAGAPADLFLSASTDWMDNVAEAGLLVEGTRIDLLGNALVLVSHEARPSVDLVPGVDLAGLLDGGHLAMALVEAVPAGIYGKAALESLGVWESVAGSVAQADNVRAALALVGTGEAPLGIVYATDAAADPTVTVIGTFPEGSHPAIVYPAARLTDNAAAAGFLTWLASPEAGAIFARHGFTLPGR